MFTPKTLEFLAINRLENSKTWYTEHKNEYIEYVQTPLLQLAAELTPFMLEIDGAFICDPKRNGMVSRIYRDARFSRDKSLYRDYMWIKFSRDRHAHPDNPHPVEFFFVFSPASYFYGCGYYETPTPVMDQIRKLILSRDEHFLKAQAALKSQNVFALTGDWYKKSRYPGEEEDLRAWLDSKSICVERTREDFDLFFSDRLVQTLKEDYQKLIPVYQFLRFAEETAQW